METDPHQRVGCGYAGITEILCHERQCCYDDSIPDVTHCFQTAACAIDPPLRVECGYAGITPDECHEIGCCFDANDATRWCYQKASKSM